MREAGKELIVYAVGDNQLAALNKKFVGYGASSMLDMMYFLRDKTVIVMSLDEKQDFKNQIYNMPWDTTTHTTTYLEGLVRFDERLEARGIDTSEAERTLAAAVQILKSDYFDKQTRMGWEKKAATGKKL